MSGATVNIQHFPPEVLLRVFVACQSIWPAGCFSQQRAAVDLGWVLVTHVCRRWRDLLISTPAPWANYATTFYNLDAMSLFLRRAANTPPVVDLDLMDTHAATRTRRPLVLELVTGRELWSKASCIVSHARNCTHLHYTPHVTSLLSQPLLRSLRLLDVFLPSALGQLNAFEAPLLSTLAVCSDARTLQQCPLSLVTLNSIFSRSPRLRSIRLHRVINTTSQEVIELPKWTHAVHELELGSFDEDLLFCVLPRFEFGPQSSAHFDIYAPMAIAAAHNVAQTFFQWGASTTYTLLFQFRKDSCKDQNGEDILYEQLYYDVELAEQRSHRASVAYRLDKDSPTWTLQGLSADLPLGAVRSLFLGGTYVLRDEAFPDHHSPVTLFKGLFGLQSIEIRDDSHMKLLCHIPETCPLRHIELNLPFLDRFSVLADVWHWLSGRLNASRAGLDVTRGDDQADITVVLRGNMITKAATVENAKLYEAPILTALRRLCVVKDHRLCHGLPYGEHAAAADVTE